MTTETKRARCVEFGSPDVAIKRADPASSIVLQGLATTGPLPEYLQIGFRVKWWVCLDCDATFLHEVP